jgi:acetolactate decarboxylase
MSDTLVGFRTPDYMNDVNVAEYHLHFVTIDRSSDVHVVELKVENGTVALDTITTFIIEFPTSGNFSKVKLGQDLKAEADTVEKNSSRSYTQNILVATIQ